MADFYHWKTGGARHHKGGPHPRRLSMAAGAPIKYPSGKRVQGRTLKQAMHSDIYEKDAAIQMPMMLNQRPGRLPLSLRQGKQPPLVAGPARSRGR